MRRSIRDLVLLLGLLLLLPTGAAAVEDGAQAEAQDYDMTESLPEEAPEADPGEEVPLFRMITVTFRDGNTVLSTQELTAGQAPNEVPEQNAAGETILAWVANGHRVADPGKMTLTEDTVFTVWTAPALNTREHIPYISGTGDGRFAPERNLTRGEAASMLYTLLAETPKATCQNTFRDIGTGVWYDTPVQTLAGLGIVSGYADGAFRPGATISRAEFVTMLCAFYPLEEGSGAGFSDVGSTHWARASILSAAAKGWVNGYADGTFQPDQTITRAQAVTILNRLLGRSGDSVQAGRLLQLGLFSDVKSSHWAAAAIAEAAVIHTPSQTGRTETWSKMDLSALTFAPGIHTTADGTLYYADRHGKLALNCRVGAYQADGSGVLTQVASSYQMPNVPYFSQIDNIYAWVGCEAVATFSGLRVKGFAQNVTLRQFLDALPRSSSDPEKGFVGSPYVPDPSKRTRTTIYPAKLAEYTNRYCGGEIVCADFRGASIKELQQELLAGNCVVGYLTLWWANPYYRSYVIEGKTQRLVSNNHAILVCGYDPQKGYYVSDPYNYYNRGQVYQYWENAAVFERIWNERKVGMIMR